MSEQRDNASSSTNGGARHRGRITVIAVAVAALAAGGAAGGAAATSARAAGQTSAPRQAGTATPAGTSSQATAGCQATPVSHGAPAISRQPFGSTTDTFVNDGKTPVPTYRYALTNAKGMTVDILSYGAITQCIDLSGRSGKEANVVLGFRTLQDYVTFDSPPVTANGGPYFGETIGRYGNRIAKGTFTLNQPGTGPVTYTLPINNGVNDLHGGLVGFGDHVWTQKAIISTPSAVGVTLELTSPNGDSSGAAGSPGCPNGCTGFPAQITVDVTFTLNNADQLAIHYKTVNDSSKLNTVVNLTNHSYFNLAGEDSLPGSAYGQFLQINANKYTPTDTTQIPLGTEPSVKGTPFDFTTPNTIGSRIDDISANFNSPGFNQLQIAEGYDHNWVLNPQTKASTGPDGLNLAARAWDAASGRELTVWTDQPGVQFYSGNFLNGTLVGISGHTYRQGAGYTFETQHFPNSPNQPNFPSTELPAGATQNTTTIFAFQS